MPNSDCAKKRAKVVTSYHAVVIRGEVQMRTSKASGTHIWGARTPEQAVARLVAHLEGALEIAKQRQQEGAPLNRG